MSISPLITFTLMMLTSASVMAHDIWLVPSGLKSHVLVFGHPGHLEKYDPEHIEECLATGIDGKSSIAPSIVDNGRVVFKTGSDIAMIALLYNLGFWTVGPDRKSTNFPKWKVPHYRSSSQIKLYNKNIFAWNPGLAKPIGLDFEIVPLINPLQLKPGDALPIQVFYKSKPLSQAEVEVMGDTNIFTTDSFGKTKVAIQNTEYQYIIASHIQPAKSNPNVDEIELSANLIFTP